MGSVLLYPELLSKPLGHGRTGEFDALTSLLTRLQLLPVERETASLATALGARYSVRAVDAVHLATAVGAGCDRFVTNNRRDFPRRIDEVAITYPKDLA